LSAAVRILESLALAPYFEAIVAPDAQQPKFASKTAMVEWLIHSRKLPPENGLLVGDSPDDYVAAAACGLDFAAARYGYGFGNPCASAGADAKPGVILDTTIELHDIADLIELFPDAIGDE
jgi:phosphoglycolate phosphatase